MNLNFAKYKRLTVMAAMILVTCTLASGKTYAVTFVDGNGNPYEVPDELIYGGMGAAQPVENTEVENLIRNLLDTTPRYGETLEQMVAKNQASYTAGTKSVYGPSLTQGELNQVAAKVHQFATNFICDGMTQAQKLDMAYSYLVNECVYADDWAQNRANTAWGALIYHEAQCSGYARAMKALCDAIDIPCHYVHATDGAHQWNIVQIDGNWYHLDSQACIYLVSDDEYGRGGYPQWDRAAFPVCPNNYLGDMGILPYDPYTTRYAALR